MEEIFNPEKPDPVDIEHMSSGLTDLLKTGFSMFMKVSSHEEVILRTMTFPLLGVKMWCADSPGQSHTDNSLYFSSSEIRAIFVYLLVMSSPTLQPHTASSDLSTVVSHHLVQPKVAHTNPQPHPRNSTRNFSPCDPCFT